MYSTSKFYSYLADIYIYTSLFPLCTPYRTQANDRQLEFAHLGVVSGTGSAISYVAPRIAGQIPHVENLIVELQ